VDLDGEAPVEQVAEQLHTEPGFAWLQGDAWGGVLLVRPLLVLQQRGTVATVTSDRGEERFEASALDLLEAAFACWGDTSGAVLAGSFGYEIGRQLESLDAPPEDDLHLPDLHLGLYDAALRPARGGHWRLEGTDRWRGEDGLPWPVERVREWLEQAHAREPAASAGEPVAAGPAQSHPSRAGYRAAVARTVERIHAGEIFQTNLCRRLEAPLQAGSTFELFRRWRGINPAAYGAYLRLDADRAVLSASPECFLRVRGRRVESRPIKGTRPRGKTDAEDRRLAAELAASDKDRAELSMIVDLVRNDLGRVCEAGSVTVERHAELCALPTVHHTVSTVSGELRAGLGIADLLYAAFPAGSITGAPKIQAMNVAAREEERRRGPAMGAIGRIDLGNGDAELSVAIRTAVVVGDRALYTVGGGIVADSDPAAELAETDAKARAFLDALGTCELDHGQV
jgi:para-aminobenzoate synthetase component 1